MPPVSSWPWSYLLAYTTGCAVWGLLLIAVVANLCFYVGGRIQKFRNRVVVVSPSVGRLRPIPPPPEPAPISVSFHMNPQNMERLQETHAQMMATLHEMEERFREPSPPPEPPLDEPDPFFDPLDPQ